MEKILNLENYHINRHGYNLTYCIDDCIASIARYENRDYKGMYLYDSFSFDLNNAQKEKKVLSSIHIHMNMFENLKNMYGIVIECIDFLSEKIFRDCIFEQIKQEKTVIMHVDGFYLPWDVEFQKRHNKHLVLVQGIVGQYIYITDPFYNKKNEKISLEDLNKWCEFYYIYSLLPGMREKRVITLLRDKIVNQKQFSYFQMELENMKNAFGNLYSREFEFQNENAFEKIQGKMLGIALTRGRYFNAIDELYEKYKIKNKIVSIYMEQIIQYWIIIKNMLTKDLFTGKIKLNSALMSKMNDIIELEIKLNECILGDFCVSRKEYICNNLANFVARKCSNKWEYANCLDIQDMLNNKAFGELTNGNNADLTGANEFILYDGNDISKVGVTNFETYIGKNIYNTLYDNIVCRGQHINILYEEKINQICLLLTSEFGEAFDKMKFFYQKEKVGELNIRLSDISTLGLYHEEIAWEGETYYKYEKNGIIQFKKHLSSANIFMLTYYSKDMLKIDELKLPNCPNIHIFAITVGRVN